MERGIGKESNEVTDKELQRRVEFFKQLTASEIWSEKDIQIIAEDESSVATFLGIKPMFLPDSGIYSPSRCIDPWKKLLEYSFEKPDDPVSEYALNNLTIVEGIGVVHIPALRSRVSLYPEVLESETKNTGNLSVGEIRDLVVAVRDSGSDLKLGAIIGFPPGSSLNYEYRMEAFSKLHKYFSKGKNNAVSDGWVEEEILDVDAGFVVSGNWDKNRIFDTLKKHQEQVGLTDREVFTFAYADSLHAFGYHMFYFPQPRNQFSERDELLVKDIFTIDRMLNDLRNFVSSLKEKIQSSNIVNVTVISKAKSVWFPLEDDDYL